MIDAKLRIPLHAPVAHRPGSVGWIKALTLQLTGSPVASMSAPGGRGRHSVRVLLDDGRTMIATRRETARRGENEAGLLAALSAEGAPVPNVIGFRDGLLLQADAGRQRLSSALALADPLARETLIAAAIASLETCRDAIERRPDLMARLPGLGTRNGWAEDYVARAVFLSGDLRIAPPQMDADAVAAALAAPPERFTRWDAHAGKAAVGPDGRVIWYDWDVFGRRAGVEDIAFLLADPYAEIAPERWDALLTTAVPDPEARALSRRMAVFVAVDRLSKIRTTVDRDGWADPVETLRYDRIGAVPDLVRSLCTRMSILIAGDPLFAGFAHWFEAAGQALADRVSPRGP